MAVTDDKPKAAGDKQAKDGEKGSKGKGKKDEDKEPELSEEDQQLKTNMELMVERVNDSDAGVQKAALNSIITEIRSATATMTSVPKPLKFLSPHIDALKARSEQLPAGENAALLADILSVLCTTVGVKEGVRDALKYRLKGSSGSLELWGHEYMRHLAGEIADEYRARRDAEPPQAVEDLMALVGQIVPHHMSHNAEPEAVDLLLEVERLDLLSAHVDEANYGRTCMYLTSLCAYLPEPDDSAVLTAAHGIYLRLGKHHDALRVALQLNRRELVESTWAACTDLTTKKQLSYLLARHGFRLNIEEGATEVADEEQRDALREILSNSKLAEQYLALARDLDVMEAKVPEDVYKSHLTDVRQPSGAAVDSARANLGSTYVNAWLNAGFGQDKLVTAPTEAGSVHWIFKNKDHGKMAATASLGLISLWDVEGALPQIDKYLYSADPYVKAGALLAIGLVSCGVANENDPAFALIVDYLQDPDVNIKSGAILGLGLAYAGTEREEISELLVPLVSDPDTPLEVAGLAGLALGLVFTSSVRDEVVMALLQSLMCRAASELASPGAKQLVLGLGLCFLGKQEQVEATLEVVKTLDEAISRYAELHLQSCAYAGTGNVLVVQQLLAACGEHPAEPAAPAAPPAAQAAAGAGAAPGAAAGAAGAAAAGGAAAAPAPAPAAEDKESQQQQQQQYQGAAVLGLALVAMAEPLGAAMAGRSLEHLLQYGEPAVRRAVPLALALIHVSNPDMSAMDCLSRLSHDADADVAQAAILALGMIGAGTNNARLAGMLRQLSSYYYKEPNALFMVRLAQGLVHAGKGLLSCSPYHTDRQLLSGMALAGLLAVLVAGLDLRSTLGGKHHYMLYCLAAAARPRMLMTLSEEDGRMLAVPVRVGQAVDVVAQAGRPKTITGFQTHSTPVLLAAGERAELATEQYLPLSPILEGLVILRKNPDYMES